MNIGFFVRHFNERGTEVASYDYAQYNELLLNNKSYSPMQLAFQGYFLFFVKKVLKNCYLGLLCSTGWVQ